MQKTFSERRRLPFALFRMLITTHIIEPYSVHVQGVQEAQKTAFFTEWMFLYISNVLNPITFSFFNLSQCYRNVSIHVHTLSSDGLPLQGWPNPLEGLYELLQECLNSCSYLVERRSTITRVVQCSGLLV